MRYHFVVGGLDDRVAKVIQESEDRHVPVVIALTRRKLGQALSKNAPVSMVGIISLDGVFPQFQVLGNSILSSYLAPYRQRN